MNKLFKTIFAPLGFGNFDEQELQDRYVDQHSRFIEIDDLTVHYRKEGSGEPLVLIHGVLASLHTWDQWVENLTDKFTVYRIDLPGFGFSTLPESHDFYKHNRFVEVLGRLFHQLGLSRFHVAGNSLGGYISWNYALLNPKQITSLTVIDPVCFRQKVPFLLKLPSYPFIDKLSELAVPKALVSFGVREVYGDRAKLSPAIHQRYFDLLMRKGNKKSFVSVVRTLNAMADQDDLGSGIKNLRVPTLVMWGARDRWIPVDYAHRWKRAHPESKLLIYPAEGHVPMEESPKITVRDFISFIQAINADR